MPAQFSSPIRSIENVRIPSSPTTWDIAIDSDVGVITSITPHANPKDKKNITTTTNNNNNDDNNNKTFTPLALPSLTHPHIHLDKAFIHNAPQYSSLLPHTGSFPEALSFTSRAKAQFTHADVLHRGSWLLASSVSAGVTAMRAFVEVDHTVQHICLATGVELKQTWRDTCAIQLVCFAQDPICSGEFGAQNRQCIEDAFRLYGAAIDVLGTTPYVETSVADAKANIDWAVDRAWTLGLHLDFHLDYHLDPTREALVWYVLRAVRAKGWTTRSSEKRVMLGHCTRLTLYKDTEWRELAGYIHENDLPVSFVGLPTSDLYMAAPPAGEEMVVGGGRPRGTLPVLKMIREYGLDAVMGVNNVGNAFTPWGSADPLGLACLGVGVYQAGTRADAELLYECVSTRARQAIGLTGSKDGVVLTEGDRAEMLLVYDVDDTGCGMARARTSIAEVVWDPPATACRDVVVGGRRRISPASLCPDTAYRFVEIQ
ncbi:hypothetical protein FE257_012831 [Aspergillus nanangensis]|uniref:Zinc metallopeptidase n=1 Tax=Aspergillus nanangensis TaxID=2582783 RepID=A0AAD4CFG7_ASPNN|nr:hypothetical protein FE257_012831 [Aspergillus nanangensis]